MASAQGVRATSAGIITINGRLTLLIPVGHGNIRTLRNDDPLYGVGEQDYDVTILVKGGG